MPLFNKHKILFLLLIVLFVTLKAFSQQYNYRNYTTRDGLASAEVYHAIQDSKGYIWFATDDGVSRFDGVNFKNFGLSDGLINNVIFDLYEDIKGRIWMISFSGQLCYYENGNIYPYKYNEKISELLNSVHVPTKNSFYIDSDENIYFSIEFVGVIKVDTNGIVSNLMSKSLKSTLEVIQVDNRKKLIAHKLNHTENIELLIDNNKYDFEYSVFRSSVLFLSQDSKGNDLIAVNLGVYKHESRNLIKVKKTEDFILWFSKDKKNRYWLSTFENGIKCFQDDDLLKNEIYHFLENKNVSSVLIDHENGYWFTTLNNGIYYLPYAEINSLVVDNEKNKNVLAVTSNNNKVYCGLQDRTLRIYDKYLKREIFRKKFGFGETPKKLAFNKNNSTLIIGTHNYCNFYDENSKPPILLDRLTPVKIDEASLGLAINDIFIVENNLLWLATNNGLFKYENNECTYRSDIESEWKESVLAIEKADSSNFWLGTFNGLWKYQDGSFYYFGSQNELLKTRINSIIEYKDDLYLATNGYGLIVYNLSNHKIKQFSEKNHLASNSVACLKQYNGQLYLATNKGLNIISLYEDEWSEILKLDENTGLLSNDINDICIEDDVLYIASKDGINSVNLNSISYNKMAPRVYIEKLEVNGMDTCQYGSLSLQYDQKNISISLIALSFKNAGNTVYKYKLEPIDNEWNETRADEINFSSLEPGTYAFKVKCKNENNVWSETNSDISFTINTPYWKKWWFISLPFIILGLIVALFLQRKLYQLRKENQLRKELKTYFYKTLATQLNPHFVFNSLNSLNKFILKEDKLNASLYLAKISNYLRAVFDTIQGEFISLQDEIEILDIYLKLEKQRLKDKIDFKILLDSSIDATKISLPALIFVPLVEKAVWTRLNNLKKAGFLKVSITKIESGIEVLIEDNGNINYSEDEINIGQDIKKRVELLNKLYKKEVSFEFIKNTKLSFDDVGNIVKLRLRPSNGEYVKKK